MPTSSRFERSASAARSSAAEAGATIATLTPDLAAAWGLRPDVVVIAGLGDGQAAGVGAQVFEPTTAYLNVGTALLVASGLSFLGLGVQPPEPEWGAMLSRGRDLLRTAPVGAAAPGLAITAVALSFAVAGDGLRDALDPKAAAEPQRR